jgi:hypothetical protein
MISKDTGLHVGNRLRISTLLSAWAVGNFRPKISEKVPVILATDAHFEMPAHPFRPQHLDLLTL